MRTLTIAMMLSLLVPLTPSEGYAASNGVGKQLLKYGVHQGKRLVKSAKSPKVREKATRVLLAGSGLAVAVWGAMNGSGTESIITAGVGANLVSTGLFTRSGYDFGKRVVTSVGIGTAANLVAGGFAGLSVNAFTQSAPSAVTNAITQGGAATVSGSFTYLGLKD